MKAKNFSSSGEVSSVRQRLAGISALVALVALGLAACGGGGGGDSDPVAAPAPAPSPAPAPAPAANPSGSISTVSCSIPAGSDGCQTQVSYTLANGVNATVLVAGLPAIPVTDGTSVSIPITLTREGVRTVELRTGAGTVLASGTVGATCVTDARWDEAVDKACRVPFYYGDTTLAIWDRNGRFYAVSQQGLSALGEETPWNLGTSTEFLFFGGFKKGNPIDEFGRIRVVMQTYPDLTPREFFLDLATMKVVGDGTVTVNRDDYDFSWQTTAEHPDWVAEARNGAAWYYVDVSGAGTLQYRENLWYWPDGAAPTQVTNWTLAEAGNLRRLQTFSHPRP